MSILRSLTKAAIVASVKDSWCSRYLVKMDQLLLMWVSSV